MDDPCVTHPTAAAQAWTDCFLVPSDERGADVVPATERFQYS